MIGNKHEDICLEMSHNYHNAQNARVLVSQLSPHSTGFAAQLSARASVIFCLRQLLSVKSVRGAPRKLLVNSTSRQ